MSIAGAAPISSPSPRDRPGRAVLRRVVASAPMRVSFAGGGTDLPHVARRVGGRVVGTAIGLRICAVVEPFDRGWIRLELAPTPARRGAPSVGALLMRRRADPPHRGVAFRLLEAALASTGLDDGVAVRIESEMAPGAGLGGSAAAAVAALSALRASAGDVLRPEDLAREAIAVERDRLGIACGGQDQVFAAFGGLLDLAFDVRGFSDVRPLAPGAPDLIPSLEAGLLLVDTEIRRVSGDVLDGMPAQSTAGTGAELVAAAAEVARGIEAGSLDQVLSGMRRSAVAKVRRAPAANAAALELAEKLRGHGVEVLRMCGAGGGGHVLVWAPPDRHAGILDVLRAGGGPCVVRRPALAAPGARIEPA